MSSSTARVVLALTVVSCLRSDAAIKCYECLSAADKNCGTKNLGKEHLVDCSFYKYSQGRKPTGCSISFVNIFGTEIVKRGCYYDKLEEVRVNCGWSNKNACAACPDDGCNTLFNNEI